ncbi:MAG: hypothetical protein QOJ16_2771 [Acidobacteriota bacterium]|jgi:hypothetical protein|nr:hypothetical protein [Acidobacteriota bacterium]
MNKVVFGLLLGGFLGIFDGLSALVSAPETRPQIVGIVVGSVFKGLITGVLIGYFARKVRSLPLGIFFGLVVGLLLAFAVAAMPNPEHKHYYWEIMLPGGVLGMIVGYATQRHTERAGRPAGNAAALLLAVLALALPGTARAEGPSPVGTVDGKAALAHLKSLAGDWKGTLATPEGPPARVQYRVTSGGNAVVETLFAGTDHEMMSVYYLERGNLLLTHYCDSGNQPHMRLDTAASTPDSLVFAFDGGTGFDPAKDAHIHSGKIVWKGDRLENEWAAYAGGKPAGSAKFLLSHQ